MMLHFFFSLEIFHLKVPIAYSSYCSLFQIRNQKIFQQRCKDVCLFFSIGVDNLRCGNLLVPFERHFRGIHYSACRCPCPMLTMHFTMHLGFYI